MILAVLASGSAVCGPWVPIIPSPATARAALPLDGHGSAGGTAPSLVVAGRKVVAAMVGRGRNNWKPRSPPTTATARKMASEIASVRRSTPSAGPSGCLHPSDPGENPLEFGILGGEVGLDLERRVQHRVGVLVGGLGPLVAGGGENVLAHDDDAE